MTDTAPDPSFGNDALGSLLSVEEMYRADGLAMASGVPGIELMERAGGAVAEAIMRHWPRRPVSVLCGPGNNGGDGFVAARRLEAAGWPVRLGLLGERSRLRGDAAHHAALWNGEVAAPAPALLEGAGLVVDALFGAGLSRPLEGAALALCEAAGERSLPVVAVDVPSGLSGDDGAIVGDRCLPATLTVTFFRRKPGHLLLPGRALCGKVLIADIGIPDAVLGEIGPTTAENLPGLWREALPERGPEDHKYRFGHLLIAGGAEITGAGRLAARAALRIGAGLVTVAAPRAAWPIYALGSASVIALPLDAASDFDHLLDDARRNTVLLGPGNGVGEETRRRVLRALETDRGVVLDADALSVFQDRPDALVTAVARSPGRVVMTPHDGEFARVFPDLTGSRLARARQAAAASRAVVLLKGADSVVAAPDGRAVINANAPASLATAGSGDVLSGMVAGLLAQGMDPFRATAAAVWLHGAAARGRGVGLIAEDLPDLLPDVLARLLATIGIRR